MSFTRPNIAGLRRGIPDPTKPAVWDRTWEDKHNADNLERDNALIKAFKAKAK